MNSREYQVSQHKIPVVIKDNVSNIMVRSYYMCYISAAGPDEMCEMMTNAPDDVVEKIIGRAKMEKLSAKYDGVQFITNEEDKDLSWKMSMIETVWKGYTVGTPSMAVIEDNPWLSEMDF